MMRGLLVLSAFLWACGSVAERGDCSASTDCPAGEWCAPAGDGRVCWPDTVPPEVTSVSAACEGPCRRDSTLRVTATVTDATGEVLDASVTLDVGGDPVPLVRSGDAWVADVDLRTQPFEHFQHAVVATVTARDGARNASAPVAAAGVEVTRLKWTYDAGAPITSPAVMDDGTVVVGRSATSEQLLAVRPDGTKAWSLTVGGTAFVTAAPAIGDHAIWVGSEDFSLYAVELDGSGVLPGAGVLTGGAIRGSVAVLPATGKEWAFAASAAGFVGAASNVAGEDVVEGPVVAFLAGPVIAASGRAYAATAGSAATLRVYRLITAPALTLNEPWNAPVGVNVSAPLAIDGGGNIWTGTLDGKLSKTTPAEASGTVSPIASLPGSIIDSPVILANDDVVVGDQTGVLHRFSSTGTPLWPTEPNLGAAVHAPLALAGSVTTLLVPTAGGKLFALRSDGSEVWSATLEAGNALRAPNVHTPAGQGAGTPLSVAYLANAAGKLFAVIVDGRLDDAAPWPKAFHDPRNTNRAGPQP
jgi:hypothetical protein